MFFLKYFKHTQQYRGCVIITCLQFNIVNILLYFFQTCFLKIKML